MKKMIGILVLFILTNVGFLAAQLEMPAVVPMTQGELVELLKGKVSGDRIVAEVAQRGVDFDLTPDIERKLRKAQADDRLVEAVRNQGPTARAARAQAGGGPIYTPEESAAFQALRNELDPDRVIQMANDFETNHPSSALLSMVYSIAASAYQQKGEIERVVEYGEKSLKLKPDNLLSLLIMASMLPQPQLLRGGDLDKEKKLNLAEAYANQALELIDALPQQPDDTEEQANQRKAILRTEPHSALGMVHLQRAGMGLEGPDQEELAKAAEEYEKAVASASQPNPQDYFRLGEAYALQNKLDEAIQAFTQAGDLGQGTVIKTYADRKVEELRKNKAASQ
jgi:tetratricopeptide (TPR) repeat protein